MDRLTLKQAMYLSWFMAVSRRLSISSGEANEADYEGNSKNIANLRAFSVDRSFTERNIPGVYDVTGVGLNYRMSEMQAALGCTQLKKIHEILIFI